MIDFSCSDCGARFKVPEDRAGKAAKCSKCGAAIRIPTAGPAADRPPAIEGLDEQWPEAPPPGQRTSGAGRRHPAGRRRKLKHPVVAWVLVGLAALAVAGVVIGLSLHAGKPPEPPPEPQIGPIYGLPGYATEHYLFYAAASEAGRADIAMRLENIYTEYSRDMAEVFKPGNGKAQVFFIGDQQVYAAAGGEALGTFRGDNDAIGPRLLVRHSGEDMYLEMTQVMQHEGWHQFNWHHVRQYCPIWVDEGLATYYSYAIWTGDLTIYGGLHSVYFDLLANGVNNDHLRPLGDLMALSDVDWRYWQSIDGFWAPYMQSWSVIQFLKHADGGAYEHLLDAYIADVAAEADTAGSAQAIAALQGRWLQWVQSLQPTNTHGRFFEAIAAALTSHLARAHLNGQTFESMEAFLSAAEGGQLQLGPVGSDTWLPPSVMNECMRLITLFRDFYAGYGLGTLELELENINGAPGARVQIRNCNIDIRATAKLAGGKIDVQITHLQPLPQRFE